MKHFQAVTQGTSAAASFSYKGDSCDPGQTSTTTGGEVLSFETLVSTGNCNQIVVSGCIYVITLFVRLTCRLW